MTSKLRRSRCILFVLAAGGFALPITAGEGFTTSIKPYLIPTADSPYSIKPLLSVGDRVPDARTPGAKYQMIGLPDGLGAMRNDDGTNTVYMNHELARTSLSEPMVGQSLMRGAFVSLYTIAADRSVLSGRRAFDFVYQENVLIGPAADATNATPAFGRFCSGNLVEMHEGFDRPLYFTAEEANAGSTFDAKGGQAVVIFDGEIHALPKMGFSVKENAVVRPCPGAETVVLVMEDSSSAQLFMYVGQKDDTPGLGVLRRNGLDNGLLYVFVSNADDMVNEQTFKKGTIKGTWVMVPNAENLNEMQLESLVNALGAFQFVRIEDGAFVKPSCNEFYFNTTGGGSGNRLGRLYRLRLDAANPIGPPTLTIIYNADRVVASGGDIFLGPDNIGATSRFLMVDEDATTLAVRTMAAKRRNASVWRIDRQNNFAARRIAEINPPGRSGTPVPVGGWESSGIISTNKSFGPGSWLQVVQAHGSAPRPNTIDDGQLVLILPRATSSAP